MGLYAFLTLFLILSYVNCSKILFVAPFPAYSHFTVAFNLAKELANRGHEITIINPFPQKTEIKNYRDISVEENKKHVKEWQSNFFDERDHSILEKISAVFRLGNFVTERTFSNKNVQELLSSNEHFDLVIIEHFVNDACVGFGHRFNVPVILLASYSVNALNDHVFANPTPSSYVPNRDSGFTKHMSFWERTTNFITNTAGDLIKEFYFLSEQRKLFKKYITSGVELDDVLHNSSLLFVNSHESVQDAIPLLPNTIEIGGYHINPSNKLPEDLQKYLDGATDGVILFSMGSNLKSKDLSPEVRRSILNSFAKIKQKVLWKFEANLPEAPANVKIVEWLPQQDVLAHPNVKVFITHGGLLSIIETVYFGVPIIGIPVFGDQHGNVAGVISKGYGLGVALSELTEDKFSWALNEILNNPKYRENVQWRSKLMQDRPLKPIDTAVYWVEHVIRHRGASHLRSAGVDLKWYQRNMIDIIIFLVVVDIVLFIIFYIIIKKILGSLIRRRKTDITKRKTD